MFVQTDPIAKTAKDFTGLFESLGVLIGPHSGNNVKCDCVFCGKEQHFFLNVFTGQWDCKVCARNGNSFGFMEQICDHWNVRTTPESWRKLQDLREIPFDAFKSWGMGYNEVTGEWLIPVYNDKGIVRDVRRWNGEKTYSTAHSLHLFGLYALANSKEKRKRRVWLAEGESDVMALRWLLEINGVDEIVTGVPGAGTFKNDWINWYRDCDVILAYDNDQAGDDGSRKAADAIASVVKRRRFLCWPESKPKGWDVRDEIKEGIKRGLKPQQILDTLLSLIEDKHRRERGGNILSPEKQTSDEIPATFQEVIATFRKWVKLDRDFVDCLVVSLATCVSVQVPGKPIWMYVIGAPGCGKTLILNSLATSETCSFHSSFSAKSLVSGFNTNPDPSLLPRLNGKTAIFKDGTELLTIHPDARREAYSTLRGAYDGRVDRDFGNGVSRRYSDLFFNVLVGVTPAIRADNQATMGERFLSIEMRENTAQISAKIDHVINNADSKDLKQMEIELAEVCRKFLLRQVNLDNLPKIPPAYKDRISAMVQLVALFRAQVDRDPRDRDLLYRSVSETPTRVAEQFVKLSRVIAFVLGKPEVDTETCRILRKIMADTCVGFHIDIAKSLIRNNNEPMGIGELAASGRMSITTVQKRIEDMSALGIVRGERHEVVLAGNKTKIMKYMLLPRVMELWDISLNGKKP